MGPLPLQGEDTYHMNVPDKATILAAQAAQRATKLWASVTIAQWAEESGWGKDEPPGSNNPFGIKARVNPKGIPIDPFVESDTDEVINGVRVPIKAPFRKFPTLDDAFMYHAHLITTAVAYRDAMVVIDNLPMFVSRLALHYATDPLYASHLWAIITDDKLTQYDLKG